MNEEREAWQEELNRIVMFLNTSNVNQTRKLWAVLTALRGPDNEHVGQKYSTTAVIRHAAGLRPGVAGVIVEADNEERANERVAFFPVHMMAHDNFKLVRWEHFSRHAKMAFDALGLSWTTNNSNSKETL